MFELFLQIVVSLSALLCCDCANNFDILIKDISTQCIDICAPNPVGQAGQWQLILDENFDGASLDENLWTTCYWWGDEGCTIASNNELEWYQPDDVIVKDGILRLRARERTIDASTGETFHYTSGMVSSGRDVYETSDPARFSLQYGYVEIRARVPRGQGLWSAFWMLPIDHNSKPEIDVLEILGHETDTVRMHVHFPLSDGKDDSDGQSWQGPDFSDGWHVFAVDWQPDVLIWYVDGIERWRYSEPEHIPSSAMYLLANLAVGGVYPGEPDPSTWDSSSLRIDYVRAWKSGACLTCGF